MKDEADALKDAEPGLKKQIVEDVTTATASGATATKMARKKEILTVALTGKGGELASEVEFLLDIPSESTPRIQEAHILLLHLLAQEIEDRIS